LCFLRGTIYIESCIGIGEPFVENLHICQNPATNALNISGLHKPKVKLEIVNTKGNIPISVPKFKTQQINISKFGSGIYFIKITNNELNMVKKVVIR